MRLLAAWIGTAVGCHHYWLPLADARTLIRFLNDEIAAMVGRPRAGTLRLGRSGPARLGAFSGFLCTPWSSRRGRVRVHALLADLAHLARVRHRFGIDVTRRASSTS
jgi:hypothetical protein